MTTIYTRQLQQYTQDNYNNTHKATTTIHTRQLQQYTQDNYNDTHKTTTTIHTRQLQWYTQNNKCNRPEHQLLYLDLDLYNVKWFEDPQGSTFRAVCCFYFQVKTSKTRKQQPTGYFFKSTLDKVSDTAHGSKVTNRRGFLCVRLSHCAAHGNTEKKNGWILITPGVRCQSRVTVTFHDSHGLLGLPFFISTRNFVRLSQTYNHVMNNSINNNNNNNNKLIRMREELSLDRYEIPFRYFNWWAEENHNISFRTVRAFVYICTEH